MTREFADLHPELRSVARNLLTTGHPDWTLVTRAGWPGLEIAETLGGAEVSFAETAVVAEELGRAAARSSHLGVSLGIGALLALSPDTARDDALSAAAEGTELPVAVLSTGDRPGVGFTLAAGGLSGTADFVPDAAEATRLLVPAQDSEGTPVLVEIDPAATGLVITVQPTLDETRRLATVTADGAQPTQVWPFPATQHLLDRGTVAIAADSLGLAEAMLAATVDYVGIRHQFGRPIGSFQAVKHACADMLVQIRVTRRLVEAAVDAVAANSDAQTAVSMAKAYASETAVAVAGKAMQLHGGIGYTWESGVHVHLKRATLNRALFGSPIAHRRALAARFR
ncbi:acyl-CoA dehydrogenase [Mycobacterium sp. Root265]|uniref:acyl-CoA dehydrogenase family protein n=1 Tax=Mycobacterium sp. Root265 TaxID=1736504 RepID=UPI00070E1228|nr:acyl-CoA dehydrogenase family protein [Mycobacterium sp. Root265]KRD14812.1 acyl-CoA dehydrogenase [Mycobacterium sp. Root265]